MRRSPAKLPASTHKQLNMYALAASVAGVGLMVTQTAEAKIVYTPKHLVLPYGKTFIDLNHDGVTDFYFDLLTSNAGESNQLDVAGVKSKNVIWGSFLASALPAGVKIGNSSKRHTGILMAAANSGTCTTNKSACGTGKWANVSDRYLGLKLYIKGKVHYGWARLNVLIGGGRHHEQAPRIDATLTGFAYETIPNKSIITGKTHGQDDAEYDPGPGASLTNPIPDIPQPSSLGALALGAPGLSIWRRKELVGAGQ